MNKREKNLAILVGAIVALFGAAYGLRALMIAPLQDMDRKTALAREQLEKIKAERRAYFAAEDTLKAFAERTFADQVDQASAKSGEMLTRLILSSGLRESDFTRLPVGPRRLRGASEIGWSVQGSGRLPGLVNLLFLLDTSPCLHRIENVTFSSGDTSGDVKLRFRFLTLVIEDAPEVVPHEFPPRFALNSPERLIYDSIIGRDILRPYIKQQPVPPATVARPPVGLPVSRPGLEIFRVVSLSEWNRQPEVHVLDTTTQKTARYKPGDSLAGGVIAMVDYRPMPMPGKALSVFHWKRRYAFFAS